MQDKKVMLIGGGTAGHIYPLFAVSEKLKESDKYNYNFVYVGSGKEIERQTAKKFKVPYIRLICGKFRRYNSILAIIQNIIDMSLVIVGFFQSIFVLIEERPDIVFSKSGYVSVPMVTAAKLFKVPVIVHESDLMPGLSTKLILPFAKKVAVAFPIANYARNIRIKGFYSGIPLRPEFEDERNLHENYILIVGGSSGAVSLNNDFFAIAADVLRDYEVVHITGHNDYERAQHFKAELDSKLSRKYEIIEYSQNIDELIRRAKLVISRAGATSIFEIAALKKKAIFVPISKSVAEHQSTNAKYLFDNGFGEVYFHEQGPKELLKKIKHFEDISIDQGGVSFVCSSQLLARAIEDELEFIDFNKVKNIFMIGIGGVSMKGLAAIFESMGKNVTGSDLKLGGHAASNINLGLDLVVYSSAAGPNSSAKPEHERAAELKTRTIKRSLAIGELLKGYEGIAVSGMHGKTTTSSLLSRMMELGGMEPSYLIGAESSSMNKTHELGYGVKFVVEACEYDGSFLDFPVWGGILTNIEEEHLDYFKGGIKQILDEFTRFVQNIYPGGVLVYCADDKNSTQLISQVSEDLIRKNISVISYGFRPSSDFSIRNYHIANDEIEFEIRHLDETAKFKTKMFGTHFAQDCAAAFALATHYGVEADIASVAASEFEGASRRFELVGEKDGVVFYDDYGHHPTEIETTLKALIEKYPKNRKILVFEPHQQKRFDDFYHNFVRVLKNIKIEEICILPVFAVAGRDSRAIKTSLDLVGDINKTDQKARYFANYDEVSEYLIANMRKSDVVMTMGATNVDSISRTLVK